MDLVPKEYKRNSDIVSPSPASKPNGGQVGENPNPALAGVKFSNFTDKQFNYSKFGIIGGAVLLILLLLAWGGLLLYQKSLNKKIEDLKKQEASVFSSQDKAAAEKIADLEKRANIAQDFLKSHVYSSGVLDSIASVTLPKVKWDSYGLNVKDKAVTLKGQAADYSTLAKQLFALDQTNYFNVAVSNVALNKEGTVGFSVNFNFDPKILQKPK